ncbi:hypothetical protein ASD24_24425 [Paenibacillus sp. Root52]|uniref:hypothetical protein n=1 Tax=Paenibacillus sp. Root52 TaxID=1736552 RepID=UPI0006FBF5C7|nr:hypothetical protein [Paenibacillus sp. Root52]KQY90946.1 hypothetical protein ASD24_24425 [Paenibacillus sp. Root52]
MDDHIHIINTVDMDDNKYLMMVGSINPQADELLEILELTRKDVVRFRDVFYDKHSKEIWVLARTGSTNSFGVNNDLLTHNQYFKKRYDDKFDSTFEINVFRPKAPPKHLDHYPFIGFEKILEMVDERRSRGEMNEHELQFAKHLEDILRD